MEARTHTIYFFFFFSFCYSGSDSGITSIKLWKNTHDMYLMTSRELQHKEFNYDLFICYGPNILHDNKHSQIYEYWTKNWP